MANVGLFRSTVAAVVSRLKYRFEDLAAASLLEETMEVLVVSAAPHWSGTTIADVPEMVKELARDRDDYKHMAESYRAQLAKVESDLEYANKQVALHSRLRDEDLDIYLSELERFLRRGQ